MIPLLPNLFEKPIPISLPITGKNTEPTCFGAESPKLETIITNNFIGSVADGGFCNHRKLTLTPHGNGTHTECLGHLTATPLHINQILDCFFFPALLISVQPQTTENDFVIKVSSIQKNIENQKHTSYWYKFSKKALIIRTLPNDESKKHRQYTTTNPPYFEPAVGEFLAHYDVMHWLCDLPSVDKESDGGALATHKAFWQYPHNPRLKATITELIFVPNEISDGFYWLYLQIINLENDASPSHPVLYYPSNFTF
ncbi:MAG: cyclase family protein [Cytophagales bacterium]|nr:cyclase family protein [Cytophagales bacterium]MDW8383679.1 cyclase family protein [Flammeovirgaceae bacterium]